MAFSPFQREVESGSRHRHRISCRHRQIVFLGKESRAIGLGKLLVDEFRFALRQFVQFVLHVVKPDDFVRFDAETSVCVRAAQ